MTKNHERINELFEELVPGSGQGGEPGGGAGQGDGKDRVPVVQRRRPGGHRLRQGDLQPGSPAS